MGYGNFFPVDNLTRLRETCDWVTQPHHAVTKERTFAATSRVRTNPQPTVAPKTQSLQRSKRVLKRSTGVLL